jgi:hypothetical protein
MREPRFIRFLADCRLVALIASLFCFQGTVSAQILMRGTGNDGRIRLHTRDMAIFAAGEDRDDLPCTVSPNDPVLGFDLRFHASYEVVLPLAEIAGDRDLLNILFRVMPKTEGGEPIHFIQRIQVPPIDEEAKGDAFLSGAFDVGEGEYEVAWLMRDRTGRVCSSFWETEAKLTGRDEGIALTIQPSEIRPAEPEQFGEEAPVIRPGGNAGLKVKVLVNFAPQNERAATLQHFDTSALVSILRTISREPRIGTFSLVAFNLQEQRIVYRQDNADRIDFPALGDSLDTLELGTVDLSRLSDKHGETTFLTDLIREELQGEDKPDALIFAGPKALLTRKVSETDLEALGELPYPIYYMNYSLYPFEVPWRDTIGNAVKFLDGQEFTITRPRDLWRAVTDMVSQIVEQKGSRDLATASTE